MQRENYECDHQENPFFGNGIAHHVYNTLVAWASIRPGRAKVCRQGFELEPGDVITSYAEISAFTGFTVKNMRTAIKNLLRMGYIFKKSGMGGLHLSICNYKNMYVLGQETCSPAAGLGQQTGSPAAGLGQHKNKITNNKITNNKITNNKYVKGRISGSADADPGSADADPTPTPSKCSKFDLELAKQWLEFSNEQCVWKKTPASWTVEKFADDIRLLRKACGLSEKDMAEAFKFIREDDFWAKQCLAPSSLRKRSRNDLRKFENVLISMQRSKNKQTDQSQVAHTCPYCDRGAFQKLDGHEGETLVCGACDTAKRYNADLSKYRVYDPVSKIVTRKDSYDWC